MNTGPTAAEIIKALGGTSAVAEICEIKPPSVSGWKDKNRIPKARLIFLRLLRPDVFETLEKSRQALSGGEAGENGTAAPSSRECAPQEAT